MFKSLWKELDDKHGTAYRETMKTVLEKPAKPKVSIAKKARRVAYHVADAEGSELQLFLWALGVFAVGFGAFFLYATWPR